MRQRDERPLSSVPPWLWAALAILCAAQFSIVAWQERGAPEARDLPPAPRPQVLRALALGETAALARITMLYLQAFDYRGLNALTYRDLDYARLLDWLRAVLATDPKSEYALFSAARVYAENPDPHRSRAALALVHEAFLDDPDRRWPWLAHAALLAKHQLKDLPLARRYAADVARLATSDDVPDWARQMEVFILEDMNELEAAKVLLGGMLAEGRIRDPAERRFLELRLKELERRVGG
ncbi:MAG: hypothetical protein AB7O31_17445 [Burkholderiales bacterium]